MNFQTLPPVETSKVFLDIAFRTAREKVSQKVAPRGDKTPFLKQRESIKLDIVTEILAARLQRILRGFPVENELSPFYQKLIRLTLDYQLYKKSFGAMKWAQDKIRLLHRQYASLVQKATLLRKSQQLRGEFYGRISSVLQQIDTNLKYLEDCRKIMKTYPDIKDLFTVCIYGFPNVGKTTLLNALTGTKAKVAAYAFTTVSINAGYLSIDGQKVQVLDVPGTLARSEKINLVEQQAELVLEEVAQIIIYVFDLTGTSGYTLAKQEELYQKIKDEKKVLVYLSKKDLLDASVLAAFEHTHYTLEEIKKKIYMLVPPPPVVEGVPDEQFHENASISF